MATQMPGTDTADWIENALRTLNNGEDWPCRGLVNSVWYVGLMRKQEIGNDYLFLAKDEGKAFGFVLELKDFKQHCKDGDITPFKESEATATNQNNAKTVSTPINSFQFGNASYVVILHDKQASDATVSTAKSDDETNGSAQAVRRSSRLQKRLHQVNSYFYYPLS